MKELEGMDVDVDVVLEGFSTYSHSRLDLEQRKMFASREYYGGRSLQPNP